ncbi:MAG: hypothetical protein ACOYMB_01985 [Patescibacteria group bacterium]
MYWLFGANLPVSIFLGSFAVYFRLVVAITNKAEPSISSNFCWFNIYASIIIAAASVVGIILDICSIFEEEAFKIISWPSFICAILLLVFSVLIDSSISVRKTKAETSYYNF